MFSKPTLDQNLFNEKSRVIRSGSLYTAEEMLRCHVHIDEARKGNSLFTGLLSQMTEIKITLSKLELGSKLDLVTRVKNNVLDLNKLWSQYSAEPANEKIAKDIEFIKSAIHYCARSLKTNADQKFANNPNWKNSEEFKNLNQLVESGPTLFKRQQPK